MSRETENPNPYRGLMICRQFVTIDSDGQTITYSYDDEGSVFKRLNDQPKLSDLQPGEAASIDWGMGTVNRPASQPTLSKK